MREQSKESIGSRSPVRLLTQPGDGVRALVKGIAAARQTVEIMIFRLDQSEVERALASAVSRGVAAKGWFQEAQKDFHH